MKPTPRTEELTREDTKISIKTEYEDKALDTTASPLSITQFIKSGQAAFGRIDPKILSRHDEEHIEVQKWMLDRVRERLAISAELSQDDVLTLRPLLQLQYSAASTEEPPDAGLHCLLPELLRLMESNLTYAVTFTNYVLDATDQEVSQTIKEDLLHAVAKIIGTVSIDKHDQRTIERQQAASRATKNGYVSKLRPQGQVSAITLGIFTKRFFTSGIYQPIEAMLAHIQSQLPHSPVADLHTIYVPFLQELISLMLIYGIPLTNTVYSSFFELVLQQYFERYVGQEALGTNDTDHQDWERRALAARVTLEAFDHSYLREILGKRYDSRVLPSMMALSESIAIV